MALPKEYEMLFRLRGILGNDFKSSFSQAAEYTRKLNKEQAELQKKIGNIDAWKKAESQYRKNLTAYEQLLDKQVKGQALTKEETKQLEKSKEAYLKAKEAMKKYDDELKKQGIYTETADKKLEELNAEYQKLEKKQQSINNLTVAWDKHSAAMQRSATHLRNWSVMYAAAMAGGYKLFVSPAADTEKSMSNVQAYFNASEAQVRELKAYSRELGLNTPYTTTESAVAFESTAKAGWSVEDSMAAMPGIINLALASEEELASVAETVTNYTKAFGIQPSGATHFADILAAAAMGSNADISDLTIALGYTAPIASSMDFSAEDVLLMLGLQANMGMKGSRAGTSMRRIMTTAGTGMNVTLDSGRELNIATTDENGAMLSLRQIIENARAEFRGLSAAEMASLTDTSGIAAMAEQYGIDTTDMSADEVMDQIMETVGGLSDAEAVAAAEAIAKKTAMGGLLTLINTSEEDFYRLAASIDNAAGSAERMAETKMDNLYGDIEHLKSALEETQITIGDALLPDMREMVQAGTDIVGTVAEWAEENEDLIRTIGEYAAKSGPFIGSVLGLNTAIHGAVAGGAKLLTFFKTMTTGGKIGLAAGIIGTVTLAIVEFEKQYSRAKLDEKFGNVSLSISQVQDAAEDLVNSGKLGEISAAFDSYENVENYRDAMLSAADAIKKKNWMVSVGIDMTPAEMNEYRSEVEDFVAKTKEYILEHSAALNMGLGTILGAENGFQNLAGAELLNEADAIGKELAEHLNTAFADGVFDPEEMNLAAEMQAKLHAVTEKMNSYAEQGQLAALKQAYGGELDRESALNLFEEVNSMLGVSMSEAKELYASTYASLVAARDNSTGEARAEAEAALAALEESGYKRMLGEASSGVMGTLTEILTGNIDVSALSGYGSQIRALMEGGLTGEELIAAAGAVSDSATAYRSYSSAEKEFLNEWFDMYSNVAPYMNLYANELSAAGDMAGAQKIRSMEDLYIAMYSKGKTSFLSRNSVDESVTAAEEMFGASGIFEELAGIAGDVNYTEGDVTIENNPVYNITTMDPMQAAEQVNALNESYGEKLVKQLAELRRSEARVTIGTGG